MNKKKCNDVERSAGLRPLESGAHDCNDAKQMAWLLFRTKGRFSKFPWRH